VQKHEVLHKRSPEPANSPKRDFSKEFRDAAIAHTIASPVYA